MTSPDVVEQGRDRRGDGPPNSVRLVGIALVVALVGLALWRSGLLSAQRPRLADPLPGPSVAADPVAGLVARHGDHLVRARDRDPGSGARLPDGLPPDAPLVPVRSADGAATLVGVRDGLLFRVVPRPGERWAPIGPAQRVVAASAVPGRVLVLRGGRVVEVAVATGRVVADNPFPGFDPASGWDPVGVVSAVGTRSLLMARPAAGAPGEELALAWPARRVDSGALAPVRTLGTYGALLGTAGDWVLATDGTCPGAACRVVVVSVTRDGVLARAVAPPPGWVFSAGASAGRTHEAVVTVDRAGEPGQRALARLVPGGDNALLVAGSDGVDLGSGLVDAEDGSVYLVTARGGVSSLRQWDPRRPGRAEVVAGGRGSLAPAARLVCVCAGAADPLARALAARSAAV